MTAVDSSTQLDEQLQDALNLVCEANVKVWEDGSVASSYRCDDPAAWILRLHCPRCHTNPIALFCGEHAHSKHWLTHGCGSGLDRRGGPEPLR